VPAVAAGVGYEIAAGKIHRLQPADWPNCPAA
jgi:hypothetical protein